MGTLNTNVNGVLSVALTGLVLILGALSPLHSLLGWVALASLAFLAVLNASFLGFLAQKRGVLFAAASVLLLFLHYTICGVGYVAGHLAPRYPSQRTPAPPYAFKEELRIGRA
jgi:hypothetical protein